MTILQQAAVESLNQLVSSGDPSNLVARLANAVPDIEKLARDLDACLPQCGHRRHRVVVIPKRWPNDTLDMEARGALPDAAILRARIRRPVVLYEAGDLSLPQVAAKLTESRPDAIDAASRLHARNDIWWSPLPQVVSE